MRLFAVVVFDSAAEAYHAPLFFPALGMAERWFRDECNSNGELSKHPGDYTLYLVGWFDTSSGEIGGEVSRILVRGSDAARKPS